VVTITDSGQCTFRIYLPNAGGIELLGSFNNWTTERGEAVQLARDDNGWWSASADLCAGEHEFCYLVDGQVWMPDYAAGGIRRNSSGRWISLVVIPDGPIAELKSAGTRDERPVGSDAGATDRTRTARSASGSKRGRQVEAPTTSGGLSR